jgi:hypothetical protein
MDWTLGQAAVELATRLQVIGMGYQKRERR